MINFKNTRFIKSLPSIKLKEDDKLKEVLFVGRSNVGKSSLLNCLCDNKNLAFVSSKPGHTKLLNFYNVDQKFYLVDAPGYGYSKSNISEINLFSEMMEDYFSNTFNLALVVFLLDSRRKLNDDDLQLISFFKEENINFVIVLTKADKLNQSQRYQITHHIKDALNINIDDMIFTSTLKKENIDKLKKSIEYYLKK